MTRAAIAGRVDGESSILDGVMHVLRTHAEHWPGGADDDTIATAITSAALDEKPTLASVLRAWGASRVVVNSALANLRPRRRQKS